METEFTFPPKAKGSIYSWHNNLYTNLLPIYTTFDLTKEEMDVMKADNEALKYATGRESDYNAAGSLFVNTVNVLWKGDPKHKNLLLVNYPAQVALVKEEEVPKEVAPNIYARAKSIVFRLRSHPKMTTTIARKLGIGTKEKTQEPIEDYTPVLKGEVVNGQPVLDCPIRGFSGYQVYCDDKAGMNVKLKSISVGRFWTDDTPLAEGMTSQMRSYRVQMLDSGNKPVGKPSNLVTLTAEKGI